MPICGIATEHGHPRLRRVLESRPFSIRKSNRDRRRAGYGVATALAGNAGTSVIRIAGCTAEIHPRSSPAPAKNDLASAKIRERDYE